MQPERVRRFVQTESGAVALLFVLLLVPLLIGAGVAVDFVRKANFAAAAQEAVDAAALAAANNLTLDDAELETLISKMVAANRGAAAALFDVDVTRAEKAESIEVRLAGKMSTTFLRVAGMPELDVSVVAEAALAKAKQVEVVLVLDYSSSMADIYDEMRDAALELIDAFEADTTGAAYEIAVVPFARYVYGTFPSDYIIGEAGGGSWTNCTHGRHWPFVITADEPTADAGSRWGSTDADDAVGGGEYAVCADYAAQGFEILPLNADFAPSRALISGLTPIEGTNIALATEIGWHLIAPGGKWGGADPFGANIKKYVIVLTDGDQHEEGHGPGGIWTVDQAVENFVEECEEMRDQEIGVFTIAYELADPDGKEALQDCAGSSAFYFEADAGTIGEVFAEIHKNIKLYPHLVK